MIDYRKYRVWQRAHQSTIDVYRTTLSFPKTEQFNLTSQINRAAVSIPTNIVEGCGRQTQKELIRFLYIASGSAHELEYLVFLSSELKFIDVAESTNLLLEISEIKKMLAALIKKINVQSDDIFL